MFVNVIFESLWKFLTCCTVISAGPTQDAVVPPIVLLFVPTSDQSTATLCVPFPGIGTTKSKLWAESVVRRISKLHPGAGA